jgi:hypothetical protein
MRAKVEILKGSAAIPRKNKARHEAGPLEF